MKRWLIIPVALLLVLAGGLGWLLATESGLRATVDLARGQLPGTLAIGRLEGRWIGPLNIAGLSYEQDGQRYALDRLDFDWQPLALLRGQFRVDRLAVRRLDLDLGPAAATPRPDDSGGLPALRLPLSVALRHLDAEGIRIHRQQQDLVVLDAVRLEADGAGEAVRLGVLEVNLAQGRLLASGAIGLGYTAPTDLALEWQAEVESLQRLEGRASLTGNLRRLLLDYRLEAPAPARLTLELKDPLGALAWQSRLSVPAVTLDRFSAQWPALLADLQLEARGDLRQLALSGQVLTDAGTAGTPYRLDIETRAADEGDGWRLAFARLHWPEQGGRLALEGRGMYGGAGELVARWQGLAWPPRPGAGEWHSDEGRLAVSGTPERYRFELDGMLAGAGLPPARLQLAGSGDPVSARVEPLQLDVLDGRISGQASADWSQGLAWTGQLTLAGLNPGVLAADWPGSIDGALEASGGQQGERQRVDLTLSRLGGTLRDHPLSGQGRVAIDGEHIRVSALALRSGDASVALSGELADRWQGRWQVNIPDLAALYPGAGGQLRGQGEVAGSRTTPRVTGTVGGEGIGLEGLALGRLQGEVDVDSAAGGDWRVALTAADLRRGKTRFDEVHLEMTGQLPRHRLAVRASGPDGGADLVAEGGWRDGAWDGRLTRGDWRYPAVGPWQMEADAVALRVSAEQLQLDRGCWRQGDARLCLEARRQPSSGLQLQGRLAGFELQRLAGLLPPGRHVEGRLDGDVTLGWTDAPGERSARVVLQLAAGAFVFGDSGDERIPYNGGDLALDLAGETAQLAVDLRLAGHDRLHGDWRLDALYDAPVIAGRLRGVVTELAVAELLTEGVEDLKGRLDLELDFAGALPQPAISGRLALQDASFYLVPVEVAMGDVQLSVTSAAAPGKYRLAGELRSGQNGHLKLDGGLDLEDPEQWRLQLAATGKDFLAVDIPEVEMSVSPDLQAEVTPGVVRLDGLLHVPYARFRPRDLTGAQAASADVQRLNDPRAGTDTRRWQTHARVRITFDEDVYFKGFGLNGFVGGDIEVREAPERLTTARGALEIREGRYKAYGQDLKIETGRLLYTNSILENPGLDFRAARHVGEITAGVRVGGTLRDPVFNLYSDPGMSESDTLSYLLFGRPLNQTSSAEGSSMMQAATALGMGGGGLLAAQVGDRLGLDEVAVEGDTADEAALMVGKYLSPRLYVGYSVGLLDPISTLRVRYQLSRRWMVQTEAGVDSGADVIYTLER